MPCAPTDGLRILPFYDFFHFFYLFSKIIINICSLGIAFYTKDRTASGQAEADQIGRNKTQVGAGCARLQLIVSPFDHAQSLS
jgi:hypothetical protein